MRTCGEYGGIAISTGRPCRRAAGWGTDADEGLCRTCLEHGITFDWESYEMPWVRLPGESSRAYDGFRTFRDAGLSRTLVAAYRQFSGRPEAAQPATYFREWYDNFHWRGRADAYDAHMEEELQAKVKAAQSAVVERLAQAGTMNVALLIAMASGRRQLPELKEGQLPVSESTQLRAILEGLDRIGARVPEELERQTGRVLETWVDIMNAVEEAEAH